VRDDSRLDENESRYSATMTRKHYQSKNAEKVIGYSTINNVNFRKRHRVCSNKSWGMLQELSGKAEKYSYKCSDKSLTMQ